jgi:2',3'-cyclic-nucleotide 2'-phosphodiesterase/3'-nucleotidase
MNSYRANGGGNHLMKGVGLSKEELKKRIIHCSDEDFRRILTRWLQEQGHYKPKPLNTWEVIPHFNSSVSNTFSSH